MNLTGIKSIIFDLGGVIVNIEPHLTAEAFARMNNTEPVDLIALHHSENFFSAYEKGLITDAEFRDHIRKYIGKDIDDGQIDRAWNALLREVSKSKVDLIKQLSGKYRLFLLSNTNHIHQIKFSRTFREAAGKNMEDYFEKVYYSFRMGMRKPDEDIFLQVMKENNLVPEETLLIDDHPPNIRTAAGLGMATLLVPANQDIIEIDLNGGNKA